MSELNSGSVHMSFAAFCQKINEDKHFREKYIHDPVGLVEDKLCIRLSDVQKDELRKTVKGLVDANPGFKLYVAGHPFNPPPSPNPGPQAH